MTKQVTTTTQDPVGAETDYTYDSSEELATETDTAVTNPVTGLKHQLHLTYTYRPDLALSEVLESDIGGSTSPDPQRETDYGYDSYGRRTSVTIAGVLQSSAAYDPIGNLTDSYDARGTHTHYLYDALGRRTDVILKAFATDPINQPTATRDVTLQHNNYDAAGRLATTVDAMGTQTDYTYTPDGLQLSVTVEGVDEGDGYGRTPSRCTPTATNTDGDVISDTLGSSGTAQRSSTASFDAAGQRTSSTVDPTVSPVDGSSNPECAEPGHFLHRRPGWTTTEHHAQRRGADGDGQQRLQHPRAADPN